MATPNIVDTKPTVLELEAGTYFWCSCGQSKNQPFCDGGHKGTEFVPEKVVLEEPKKLRSACASTRKMGHSATAATPNCNPCNYSGENN